MQMPSSERTECRLSKNVVPLPPSRRQGLRRTRLFATVAVLLLAAVGGGTYWEYAGPTRTTTSEQPKPDPIPVSVATAKPLDVPLYLTGLGTVQASTTVSVRTQVDGKLQEVLFTEGQHVKKGDVLIKIDPRLYQAAYDQAVAKKAQDEAQLIAAEKDLARFKTLGAKGFDTQQNIDNQQAKVDTTKAAIAADKAAIDTAQTQLDYTTIIAPSDGRVGVRQIDPGNIVHAADQAALVTLTQTQPSAVIFTLPSYMLDNVIDAMNRGTVEVAAYDRDNKRSLAAGTLLLVDDLIDQATATIRLKAMFPNEQDRLWPGEFVNVRLLSETRHNVLTIPSSAVQRGPDGLFAWVVSNDEFALPRPIEVGPSTGDLTIVDRGLAAGERVVVEGQFRLQVNAPVSASVARSGARNS
jgi:membrane fusion protein, multidrug efflux system